MAGFMKNAMSYLGMTDVVDDDPVLDEEPAESSFDSDHSVTPMTSNASSGTSGASRESSTSPFPGRVSRITTIHPKTYDEAQMVGRALRDGVPVVLHESDLTPGLANKLCAPFAKAVCTTFPETAKAVRHGVYTGTPLRDELFAGQRKSGLAAFSLSGEKPVLMVTGGSSGAQAINAAVRAALPKLLPDFDVLHLCGKGNLDPDLDRYAGYRQIEYLTDRMRDAFACADVLVSRAGSNTLCEILALKKPSLLIPYPKGASRGDQVENAASFAARGLAQVLDQASLTPESLLAAVRALYASKDELRARMDEEPAANGTKKVLEILEQNAKRG